MVLLLAPMAPALGIPVTGTFTGYATSVGDPDGVTYLGETMSYGDNLTGSFSFDTADISSGVGTNTLNITINDTTAHESWTYNDEGTDGYFGDASYFSPVAGEYGIEAGSGTIDYVSQAVLLNFLSPSLRNGVYDPTVTIGPGSGSNGAVYGDYEGFIDGSFFFTLNTVSIVGPSLPEPASMAMLLFGLLGLAGARRLVP